MYKTLYVLSVYSVTKWFFFLSFGCINKSCCEVSLYLVYFPLPEYWWKVLTQGWCFSPLCYLNRVNFSLYFIKNSREIYLWFSMVRLTMINICNSCGSIKRYLRWLCCVSNLEIQPEVAFEIVKCYGGGFTKQCLFHLITNPFSPFS